MPFYRYQCPCGVQFEGMNPMARALEPKECPECGELAPRMMPKSMTGQFNLEVNGPGPQNTGIHDLDTHIDRVIGASSEQNREVHRKRVEVKRQVMANTGAKGEDLSRNPDGSYRVLAPEEKAIHQRANKINSLAMSTLHQKRESNPERA